MKTLNAYLHFDGTCREVMGFYARCLGAELTLSAFPDATGAPSTEPGARTMHSMLTMGGGPVLMAADSNQPGPLTVGDSMSLAIDCSSVEEGDRFFAALSEGGTVTMPMMDAPWGARFGMLKDKYGIVWLINCALQ